jgi:hypothetical protein
MSTPRRRTRWTLCFFLANTPALTGCFAVSSYQSARMTEPGPARPTIAVSSMGSADDPEEDRITVIDLRVRKALGRNVADMAFTGSIHTMGDNGAMATVGIEPRVAIVNKFLAVGVPMSWPIGIPVVQYAPGVVLTLPLSKHFEINTAARLLNTVAEGGAGPAMPVYNVGIGLSKDLRRWAIRPEVGFMRADDGDSDGWIVQFGVGFDPPVPSAN